jgi:predicted N-acetyltransferase YhbS
MHKQSVHQTQTTGRESRVSTQLRLRPSLMNKARRIADREGIFIGRVIEWAIDALPEDKTSLVQQ